MSEPSATPEPYAVHARAAGLSYICDVEPGIRRSIKGRGFSYLSAGGRRISHAPTLRRIRALAVPPAWTDVWICPDGNGHIHATGHNAHPPKHYPQHKEPPDQTDPHKVR